MSDVTLLTAFAAGILALLSPCSALLVPSFFAYAFSSRTALAARTVIFWLGLATVLVPLGMGSSLASSLVYQHRQSVINLAGAVIIALGVLQVLGRGFAIPFTDRLQARSTRVGTRGGFLSTFWLGAVYGLAGFCSGPVLGAILTMAAVEGTAVEGGLLLATYTVGMAAPLFLLALLWDRFDLGRRAWLRGRPLRLGPVATHTTSLASGLLFVGIGVLFMRSDGMVGLTGMFGDLTDLEFQLQDQIDQWLGPIPTWALLAAVSVAALVVAWRRRPGVDAPAPDASEIPDAVSD